MPVDVDTDTSQIRLGRNWLRTGDPCRWRGHHGLFRFIAVDKPATDDTPSVLQIVGPYKKAGGRQVARYVHADQVVRILPTERLRAFVAQQ